MLLRRAAQCLHGAPAVPSPCAVPPAIGFYCMPASDITVPLSDGSLRSFACAEEDEKVSSAGLLARHLPDV